MDKILYGTRANKYILISGIIFYWLFTLYLYQESEVPVEPGDGITHYQIAHYAFKYPGNFLKHWGKPIFTLLTAPFAQLGFVGMILFNLLVFTLSSWFLYQAGKRLHLVLPGLAPFILMSSMVYFKMVNAGMTEILMAGLGIASLYFVVSRHYTLAAIIASLSIVARPESIILIPMMALLLAWERQWKAIPWLAFGFLIFTFIGYFFGDKPLGWVISEDPYPAISPYGHGDPNRFFGTADLSLGYFIIVGMIAGLVYLIIKSFRNQFDRGVRLGWFSLIVVLLVMLLHSYLWWKGLKGSLGLIRVIASVIPLAAFVTLLGFGSVLKSIRLKLPAVFIFLALLVFGDIHAYSKSWLPRPVSPRERIILEACAWYTENAPDGILAYYDPYFSFILGFDPYDGTRVVFLGSLDKKDPSRTLDNGDVIIWDSLFGPREAGIPRSAITDNESIEVIRELQAYGNQEILIARVVK